MTTFTYETEEHLAHPDQMAKVLDPVFSEFDSVMNRYALFHLFFITLCIAEIVLLVVFFTVLVQSYILALSLGAVFFTFFAYFTLRIYFQTKKPEQISEIKEAFVESCKELLDYNEGDPEKCFLLANACCKLANKLHAREYSYYRMPRWLGFLAPFLERLSCWLHWQDVHLLKELLLQASVNEHIQMVKCRPTSLQTHAALANAYVMLSGLYVDPRKIEGYDDELWLPADKYNEVFEAKFRATAERAIEEFKILSEYAPDDPWVHSQLAYSYHDLQMPLEEIKEYETIYKLAPDDKDNLLKLGILYFQQGLNAKGLRVYEDLRKGHHKKAEALIRYYGYK